MGAETRTRRFSEQTLRQVRLDCSRAMIRARFCPEQIEVLKLRCIDDRLETEESFGNQLWYFEGYGVDERLRRQTVFGAIEYSIQFGLHELVEDGVFESEEERDRFRCVYEREIQRPSQQQAAHRWVALALVSSMGMWLAIFITKMLVM